MMSKETGGPAFPIASDVIGHAANMTVRDYFAAKAMQAMISKYGIYDESQPASAMSPATALDYHSDEIARTAYTYADSMLEARKQ